MRVIPIHAANPSPMTGAGNWTYLIPGDRPVLIDAGDGRGEHLDAVAAAAPSGPAVVAVTHGHNDHASGAPAMAARWPAAEFRKWPWPGRDARFAVAWQGIGPGEVIDTGEGPLVAVHTPGHAPDHVTFWHAATRTAFTGDLLVQGSTVVILTSQGGRLVDYLASLERVRALRPARLLPAHGPAIEEPERLIDEYVAHRRMREAQVLEALADGLATVDAIVARIYPGLQPALVGMAGESVRAHLQKLADEGRAVPETPYT
ncbi:MAG: MBL fold metallo-hydrolase [Vicinamibacterales bacterium]